MKIFATSSWGSFLLACSSPPSGIMSATAAAAAASAAGSAILAEVLGMIWSEIVWSGSWSSKVALASERIWRYSDGGVLGEGGEGRWIACRDMEG